MVAGLPPRKIVVVDLDGTLIKGNSLHLFLRTAFRHGSSSLRLTIAWWLMLRRLRIVSHARMKFALLRSIKHTEALRPEFTAKFDTLRRPEVKKLLDDFRKDGCTVILATAAPDTYVPWIWDGEFVATAVDGNTDRSECRGERKRDAVRSFMREGDKLEAVITDHSDDLPLLSMGACSNILVEPASETIKKVNASGIDFTVITS